MSGASDKARFYLEQAIPQLQEFEQKKIFSKDEIKTLVKKRSAFEHKLLARGSTPVDFARYAAWEISLERLRQKRCKRLRIKGSSAHAGQGRVFLIFDRGTRKHFGDLGLWMSYLEYARQAKANKKFKTVLTAALRMHPTKAQLWLYAAKWALEAESDMNGARSFMQRGTRFCNRSKDLWIEYAKLEMIYLAKIGMRRRVLGLDEKRPIEPAEEMGHTERDPGFATGEYVIHVPDFESHRLQPKMIQGVGVDTEAVQDPMTTPALSGAIPLAIFDDVRKQPFYTAAVAEDFFNMFSKFSGVSCLSKLLQHVVDSMMETHATDPSTCSCFVRQHIVGVSPLTPEFPAALATSLDRLKTSREKTGDRALFAKKTRAWTEPVLALGGLDDGIRKVLLFTLRSLEK